MPVTASTKCNVVDLKKRAAAAKSPRHHAAHHHDHSHDTEQQRLLKHDNHLDVLVNDETGNLRLHCRDPSQSNVCQEKGTLTRVGNDPSSMLVQFMDWLDLFFPSDQASTSVIKVSKGLCCKKEVPKIETALSTLATSPFNIDIDPKLKSITVWHGGNVKEAVEWMVQACDALRQNSFVCDIVNVAGEKVIKSEVVIESVAASEGGGNDVAVFDPVAVLSRFSPSVLHVKSVTSEDENHVVVFYHLEEDAQELLKELYLQCINGQLPGWSNVKVNKIGSRAVSQVAVKITKGLCCKKEIPKIEALFVDLPMQDVVSFRILPKEKRVDVQVFEDRRSDFVDALVPKLISIGMVVASVNGAEYVVPKRVAEEEEEKAADPVTESSLCVRPEPTASPSVLNSAVPTSVATIVEPSLSSSPESSALVKSTLSVQGVCCQSEVPSVLACCKQVDGVVQAHVNVIAKQVIVTHPANRVDIPEICAKLLSQNEFPSEVISNGAAKHDATKGIQKKQKTVMQLHLKWYVVLATILWLVSWLSYVRPPEDMQYLKYLSVGAVALGLPKIALKGLRSLTRRIMDVNILMSIAVIGALALQDFHEAASVTVIFSWSDWLEDRASRRARQALLALMELKPDVAYTESGEEIAADAVVIDQILVVRNGDKIPVDGELLSPYCDVDESTLTGEARPVTKRQGDLVNAGTLNVSNQSVKMKCTAIAENSAVARMIRLVEEASNSRSPTEQIVETVAKYYTPIVVLMAICMASIPWVSGPEVGNFWLHTALTLLVVSCPCALIISTPITYVCGLAQAARFGVLVKGGRYLETLSKVKALGFDKTGTLTKGEFAVDDVLYIGGPISRPESLRLLKNMEIHATHPIARAIQKYCEQQLASVEGSESLRAMDVEELEVVPGQGVKANLVSDSANGPKRVAYVVGTDYKDKLCTESAPSTAAMEWLSTQFGLGRTVSWLVLDSTPLLAVAASDQIRLTATETLESLGKLGVETVLLTGDNPSAAKVLHDRLPALKHVFGGLTPKQKVEHVTLLKGERRNIVVAMIGDGVNDAPALSASDVGIAMGASGAPLALETADCALMDNDLTKIPRLLRLAKRTRMKIIQNVSFSLISKAVMLGLTIAGFISLGVAIAVDVVSMLLVTLNGVSLLEGTSVTSGRSRLSRFCGRFMHVHGHSHKHHKTGIASDQVGLSPHETDIQGGMPSSSGKRELELVFVTFALAICLMWFIIGSGLQTLLVASYRYMRSLIRTLRRDMAIAQKRIPVFWIEQEPFLMKMGLYETVTAGLHEAVVLHDRWIGELQDFSHYQGWILDAGILFAFNVVMWLLSLILGKCWPADIVRSVCPGIHASLLIYRSPVNFISPKQWLYLGVVWFYGVRMLGNFVYRGGIGREDWRYEEMRETVGRKWFPLLSFPMVFLGQSTFTFVGCLPLYGMLRNRFSTTSLVDVVGITTSLGGIVLETAADEQMDSFKFETGRHRMATPLPVMDKGLWAYSRHPNYFGECLFWLGLWISSDCELGPALIGPICMTLLFFGLSIPLMEERQLERRGEAYEIYLKQVPSSFFLLPPRLSRTLWPFKAVAAAEEPSDNSEEDDDAEIKHELSDDEEIGDENSDLQGSNAKKKQ